MRTEYVVANGKVRLGVNVGMFKADPKFVRVELLTQQSPDKAVYLSSGDITELVGQLHKLQEEL